MPWRAPGRVNLGDQTQLYKKNFRWNKKNTSSVWIRLTNSQTNHLKSDSGHFWISTLKGKRKLTHELRGPRAHNRERARWSKQPEKRIFFKRPTMMVVVIPMKIRPCRWSWLPWSDREPREARLPLDKPCFATWEGEVLLSHSCTLFLCCWDYPSDVKVSMSRTN